MKGFGRVLSVLAIFILLGPPLGALGLMPIVAGYAILKEPADAASQLLAMLVFTPFAMIGAWWFGFAPALATGVIGAVASPWLRDGRVWMAAMAVVGALAAFALPVELDGLGTDSEEYRVLVTMPGALGALACAWITRRFRPGRAARERQA